MRVAVHEAASKEDFTEFGLLVRQYTQWCADRYKDYPGFVDAAFNYQSLDTELSDLSRAYGPPIGRTILAVCEGETAGCGAYHRLSDGSCEIKRMFVPTRFHRKGVGKKICQKLISSAQADGYSLIRLDSGNLFSEAHELYHSLGFVECAPYVDYPKELQPFIIFMELRLSSP
jgi:GNAT superfamily N-acetyltransferase